MHPQEVPHTTGVHVVAGGRCLCPLQVAPAVPLPTTWYTYNQRYRVHGTAGTEDTRTQGTIHHRRGMVVCRGTGYATDTGCTYSWYLQLVGMPWYRGMVACKDTGVKV